jgi:hypothetical protein
MRGRRRVWKCPHSLLKRRNASVNLYNEYVSVELCIRIFCMKREMGGDIEFFSRAVTSISVVYFQ